MRKNNLIVCTFCENPAVREISDDLDFFSESNRKVFLCMTCYKIFNAGSILGQFQLNNKMINLILSSDDSETVVALKNKLSEIVPSSSAKLKAAIPSGWDPKQFDYKYKEIVPEKLQQISSRNDWFNAANLMQKTEMQSLPQTSLNWKVSILFSLLSLLMGLITLSIWGRKNNV